LAEVYNGTLLGITLVQGLVVPSVKLSESRAKATKFIFAKMEVPGMPVTYGTEGTKEDFPLHHYQFEGIGEPEVTILKSDITVVETLKSLGKKKENIAIVVVVVSLCDISKLTKKRPNREIRDRWRTLLSGIPTFYCFPSTSKRSVPPSTCYSLT
jgi:hypothetical protein